MLANIKKRKYFILVITIFLLSRIFLLANPPAHYSDVSHDYERYANIWWYGLTPYLEHYYEYPPATIPLLTLPLALDLWGFGNYYQNYRLIIFIFDFLLFLTILKTLHLIALKKPMKYVAVLFYIVSGVIAKDFYYEGIDLFFAGCLSIAICTLILLKSPTLKNKLVFWIFFWLSFGIKFMSLPLLPLFFLVKKISLKKEILAVSTGFLLVWGLPLAIFRSSLSVSFVFHAQRPLKYSSFPSYLIEGINLFTKSESRVAQPPDFQMAGPISDVVTQITSAIFPLSIILLIFILSFILYRYTNRIKKINLQQFIMQISPVNKQKLYTFCILSSLSFFLTIFLTGKVFSQPFPIWLIPLISLYPFKNIRFQLSYISIFLIMLIILTTPWIKLPEQVVFLHPFTIGYMIQTVRVLSTIGLWILTLLLLKNVFIQNKYVAKKY